ncbi:MAG: hypothetical protein EAZ55_09320 [Cytophagales bacterium]|nr:MAG: hypothetical protein EAZ55_09320 [Cytophagales bacterium]
MAKKTPNETTLKPLQDILALEQKLIEVFNFIDEIMHYKGKALQVYNQQLIKTIEERYTIKNITALSTREIIAAIIDQVSQKNDSLHSEELYWEKQNQKNEIRKMIAKNDMEAVFSRLEQLSEEYTKDFQNPILVRQAEYERLKEDEVKGIINREDAQRQRNQIITALLEMVEQIFEET